MLCFFSALEDAGGFFEVVSPCRFGRLARLTYIQVLLIWLPQLGLRIDCLPKPCPLQKALCSRQEAGAKNAAGAVFFLQASIVNCKQHVISQYPSFVQKWLKGRSSEWCEVNTMSGVCINHAIHVWLVDQQDQLCIYIPRPYLSFVPRFHCLRPLFKTNKVEGSTSKRRFPSMQICLPDIFWTQKWSDVRRQEGLGKECSLSECTWSYLSHWHIL